MRPHPYLSLGTSDEVPDSPNQAMTSFTCYCTPRTGPMIYPHCICPYSWNSSHQSSTEQRRTTQLEATMSHALHHQHDSNRPGSPTTELSAVQKKKLLSAEDIEPRSEENLASPTFDATLKCSLKTNGGGKVDYKKLWEESQEENSRLRSEMEVTRQDLDSAIQLLVKSGVRGVRGVRGIRGKRSAAQR